MTSANHVGARSPSVFGYYTLAAARSVNIAAVANAVVALPILEGGLTNSGANTTSGCAIVRKITIGNYSAGNCALLNVSVGYTNDGANLVAAVQNLSSITSNNMFQDLTLNATGNNTFMNGNVSSTLYFNVTGNVVASGTVDVFVYGSVFRS